MAEPLLSLYQHGAQDFWQAAEELGSKLKIDAHGPCSRNEIGSFPCGLLQPHLSVLLSSEVQQDFDSFQRLNSV